MLENANVKSALSAIRINPANFQVFSVWIAASFFIGLLVILGSSVQFLASDQSMTNNETNVLVVLDLIVVGLLVFAMLAYLRNIGKYVYGRIRPISFEGVDPLCMSED